MEPLLSISPKRIEKTRTSSIYIFDETSAKFGFSPVSNSAKPFTDLKLFELQHMFRLVHCLKAIKPGSRVLDIGCGAGDLGMLLYVNWFKCEYWGLDVYKILKRAAERPFGKSNPRFVSFDLYREDLVLPFRDESFDFVVAMEIIEHVERKMAVELLKEVSRVLKKSGLGIVSTPNVVFTKRVEVDHCYEWRAGELRETLEEFFAVVDEFGFRFPDIRELDKCLGSERSYTALRKFLPTIFVRALLGCVFPAKDCIQMFYHVKKKI